MERLITTTTYHIINTPVNKFLEIFFINVMCFEYDEIFHVWFLVGDFSAADITQDLNRLLNLDEGMDFKSSMKGNIVVQT